MTEDRARYSRSGESHFLGKCDDSIEVAVPNAMKADLAAVAHLMDPPMTPSELVRLLLSDFLYGRKVQVQRIVGR